MSNKIRYLNTDLDLESASDLTELVNALEAQGMFTLHLTHAENGKWSARLETGESFAEPGESIAAMLGALDSLPQAYRQVWENCELKEFNIGYDCGDEPWAYNQGLTSELLRQMTEHNMTLRWTLYPAAADTGHSSANPCQNPRIK